MQTATSATRTKPCHVAIRLTLTSEEGRDRDSRLKDKGMGESSDTTTGTDFNNNKACTLKS